MFRLVSFADEVHRLAQVIAFFLEALVFEFELFKLGLLLFQFAFGGGIELGGQVGEEVVVEGHAELPKQVALHGAIVDGAFDGRAATL